MPRPRQRACLEHGLKLDLNRLTQRGFVRPRRKVWAIWYPLDLDRHR